MNLITVVLRRLGKRLKYWEGLASNKTFDELSKEVFWRNIYAITIAIDELVEERKRYNKELRSKNREKK